MNIAFFLTPKKDIVFENLNSTMRQALERMEHHRYTAIPILDDKGRYIGTLTEGDLLWKLKNTSGLDLKSASKIKLDEIPRRMVNKPIHINSNIEDLIYTSVSQNFVPVVDDNDVFIGIIKRSDIINHFYKKFFERQSTAVVL
ncbi:CBS domain-containing protein [Clostridium thailandense]|uniref:CBS domain-containing protein n=1 Tax=Clostridium thailandense TaxID=2794346 RepID=A0A949U1G7_9CLOT|nr:CBS domain-containing protein [Clostridium thailandense]MBV7275671.1 CBS domain-containing protein [Clostridium thailandense]